MARTSEQITQTEINTFLEFCNEYRIVADGEAGRANGDLIGEYIAITWGEDITPRTLAVALEKLRDRIAFYTPAQFEYKKLADEDSARANALNTWFNGPGNTSLVRDGEQAYKSQTALLTELRGREVNSKNIQDAIGRASFKGVLHMTRTSNFKPGRHSGSDSSFLSKSDTNLTPLEKNRRAREASDQVAGRTSTPTPMLDSSEQAWKDLAAKKLLNGKFHSQIAELQRVYDTGGVGTWRKVNDEMAQIIKRWQGKP